jgi:phage tail P2-like protein
MAEGRINGPILPGSVADDRGRAFAAVLAQAVAEPDFRALLFERFDIVPEAVLPFLVREFGIEDLVSPGLPAERVRRLLASALDINRERGRVSSIRRGLAALGIRVDVIQWYQESPRGPRGTHRIRVTVTEHIWGGAPLIDGRVAGQVRRMIDGTKRWSQDEAIEFVAETRAGLGVAGAVAVGAAVRARLAPQPPAVAGRPAVAGAIVVRASVRHFMRAA